MSSLSLYYGPKFIRPIVPLKLINFLNIKCDKIDITTTAGKHKFEQDFKWHKVPCLKHNFGDPNSTAPEHSLPNLDKIEMRSVKISECLAVCHYLINYSGNRSEIRSLLGDEFMKQSQILRWSSLAVSDLLTNQVNYIGPNIGIRPWNKPLVEQSMNNFNILLNELEDQLKMTKKLTGDQISLADLLTMGTLSFAIKNKYNKDWGTKYPKLSNWCDEISNSRYWQTN